MPAAGTGLRFGHGKSGQAASSQGIPKQYTPLAGRTVIEWALAPFLQDERCLQIVVALAPGDAAFDALPPAREPRLSRVPGGAQRAASVAAALQCVAGEDSDWVLVHDAARPCVTRQEVDALLECAGRCVAGALLALPVADTLKRADAEGLVVETPSRETLWRALTPQMFPRGLLRRALDAAREAGRTPTDEAQAVEWLGMRPQLVPGNPQNLKVTHAGDLDIAAAIIEARQPARQDAWS
jgi:2-C-methyl-D-erythritol 4-phosphate cytidylyltransferase